MNPDETKGLTTTAEAAAGDPPVPVPTIHQQRASACIAAINDLVATLPPAVKTPIAVVRAHRAVPKQFMKNIIAVVQQDPDVRAVTALDTAASGDRFDLIEAYEPLLLRAMQLVQQMNSVLDTARSQLAYDTLDAYNNIKRLARRPGAKQLAFKVLEKNLGRKRSPKDPKDPADPAKVQGSPGVTPPIPPAQNTEVSAKH